jgi:hypothetical protein
VAFELGEEQDAASNMAGRNKIPKTESWWKRLLILLPMQREAGWGAALAALVAAFFLGLAIQSNNGAGSSAGFQYLALALLALILGVAFGTAGKPGSVADKVLHWLGGAVVLFQLWELGTGPPAIYLSNTTIWDFASRLVVFAALGFALLGPRPLLGRAHVAVWLAAFGLLAAWLVAKSPNPSIDVFAWTNHALKGLSEGKNPYSMALPNIYHTTNWWPPGLADHDWVYGGFPYPPLSLELSGLGHLVGDVRWANIACLAIAALTLVLGQGQFGALAAVLLLTTPRILFVVEQAWTDAVIVGVLGVVVWSAVKWPKATPYLFGLLLVSKQYMIFVAPLVLFLVERPWTRRRLLQFAGKAAAAGLVVNLPFLLMGPVTLVKALLLQQLQFRPDSLSFLAATAKNGIPQYPKWIQIPLLLPAYVLVWLRAPRGPVGFALGAALILSVFFSFSGHAFCNHHFLVLGCACIALGSCLRLEAAGQVPAKITARRAPRDDR